MERKNMKYIKVLLLVCICLAAKETIAQSLSVTAMEQMRLQRLWAQSQNAAGMVFDAGNNYSSIELKYDWENGNFCRPQEGQKETNLNVNTEGYVNLGNAYVWGAFNFTENNLKDAGYNASITDPYRGMPYYVVDQHLSDWRQQHYDLRFRASTPLIGNHWAFGLEGSYVASIAAKQRDPRVDTRFYTLELIPALTYRLTENHRLGLSLKYTSLKEDSRMSNESSYVDQDYYIMYGLGVAMKGIGAGRESNYYGDRWGGALQYNYAKDGLNLMLEGSYDWKAEVVEQSFTTPKKDAAVKDKTASLSFVAYKQGDKYSHYLKAVYLNRHIDGIQYLSQRDNSESQSGWVELYRNIRSTYQTNQLEVQYAWMKNRGAEYNWKLQAEISYLKQDDEYLLPNSVKNSENVLFALAYKKNFVLNEKFNRRLLLDVHANYNHNIGGEYKYGGNYADYLTVTKVETYDSEYLTSSYYALGASLTYSQQVKQDGKMNMFVKAAFDRQNTSDYQYDGRSYVAISLGCNF